MKHKFFLPLLLVLILLLTGCAVTEVENTIATLGVITLDSGDAVTAARNAYDALSENQQRKVSNIDLLVTAEDILAEMELAQENAVEAIVDAQAALEDALPLTLDSGNDLAAAREVCEDAQDAIAVAPEPDELEKEMQTLLSTLEDMEESLEDMIAMTDVIAEVDALMDDGDLDAAVERLTDELKLSKRTEESSALLGERLEEIALDYVDDLTEDIRYTAAIDYLKPLLSLGNLPDDVGARLQDRMTEIMYLRVEYNIDAGKLSTALTQLDGLRSANKDRYTDSELDVLEERIWDIAETLSLANGQMLTNSIGSGNNELCVIAGEYDLVVSVSTLGTDTSGYKEFCVLAYSDYTTYLPSGNYIITISAGEHWMGDGFYRTDSYGTDFFNMYSNSTTYTYVEYDVSDMEP